mmetsp:Transcript_5010/g.9428  ORF Transcript_5010/g.9428 Transcript_5010/m.9428 type:complete len:204 (+) Transcript_5010:1064-1675(+)
MTLMTQETCVRYTRPWTNLTFQRTKRSGCSGPLLLSFISETLSFLTRPKRVASREARSRTAMLSPSPPSSFRSKKRTLNEYCATARLPCALSARSSRWTKSPLAMAATPLPNRHTANSLITSWSASMNRCKDPKGAASWASSISLVSKFLRTTRLNSCASILPTKSCNNSSTALLSRRKRHSTPRRASSLSTFSLSTTKRYST